MILSLLMVLEIAVLKIGIFSIIRKRNDSISMSFAYAAVLTLTILSLSIQAVFMLGIPGTYFLVDTAIIIFSTAAIIKNKEILTHDAAMAFNFVRETRLAAFVLMPVLVYLFLQAFLVPPSNLDSMVYNLARVFMFERGGTMFIENYSYFSQVSYPVGFDLLSYFFLRFNSDFGLGIFSFISYLTIISATFSLVRCFYDKHTVVTVTIITASLTEIVLQAVTTKNDIPAAAVVTVIFLSGYHFAARRNLLHFYMMTVSLLWGLTVKGYFPGFFLPFVLFYTVFFFLRAREKPSLKKILKAFPINRYIIIPAGLIICLGVFYGANLNRFGNIWGEKKHLEYHQNQDGIAGAVINMGRYLAQSAEIPIKYGYKLNEIHDGLLGVHKSKGLRDKKNKVDLAGKPFYSEDHSWYGPLGFLLILPALLFCLVFAKGYTRIIALTLLSFFVILSYKVAWMPWNSRLFSLFFAGSGLCTAYVLHRFLKGKHILAKTFRGIIVIIAIYVLLSAVLLNDQKSTVPKFHSTSLLYNLYRSGVGVFHGASTQRKWFSWLKKVTYRGLQYNRFFPKNMLNTYVSSLEKGKKVLVMGYYIPVFPFFIKRPDLDITVSKLGRVSINNRICTLSKKSDYDDVREHYDYIIVLNRDIKKTGMYTHIREEEQLFYAKKGAIFRLRPH